MASLIADNIQIQRDLLEQIKKIKEGNGNGNGGNGKSGMIDRAWEIMRWFLIPWMLWVSTSLIRVQETRFTETDGAKMQEQIQALLMRIIRNERDINANESNIEQHVRDHNGTKR